MNPTIPSIESLKGGFRAQGESVLHKDHGLLFTVNLGFAYNAPDGEELAREIVRLLNEKEA